MCKERKDEKGSECRCIYVLKRNAKAAKSALEEVNLLNKNFRMGQPKLPELHDCIAIPVVTSFDDSEHGSWTKFIVEIGRQVCPYSTSVLGNGRRVKVTGSADEGGDLTMAEQALVETILSIANDDSKSLNKSEVLQRIRDIGSVMVPKRIEVFGDDRTLVVPPGSFEGDDFDTLLLSFLSVENRAKVDLSLLMTKFWENLARLHTSPRIVRRGVIDKESKIRHSGHVLVWPHCSKDADDSCDDLTGPGSPGWITVTEQGIKQSFDLTLVMFSRGNISEKIRFGKIVQEGETVLDMYAGIGYYTLPALLHGKASHVYACEWNPHATHALRYNIVDNNVEEKVTIFEGDCRVSAKENNLVGMFDRVSLGLLPSSEGGWPTAVRALKRDQGGWLHVHANVPEKEVQIWGRWLCRSILNLVDDEFPEKRDWVVICCHVERVKSFAPTISHYVADVFVGPARFGSTHMNFDGTAIIMDGHRAGIINRGIFSPIRVNDDVIAPTCALSPDGALSQRWMR